MEKATEDHWRELSEEILTDMKEWRKGPRDTQRDRSNRAEKWKVDDDGELLILWHTERVLR